MEVDKNSSDGDVYDYDGHVRIIERLRNEGNEQGLQQARERMHEHFALSPELWLQWISDDIVQGKDNIEEMYNKAIEEYQNVEVWQSYVTYAKTSLSQEKYSNALDRATKCFEKDIDNCHVFMHEKIRFAIEFGDQEAVRSLFLEIMATPHSQHEKTMEMYQAWKNEQCESTQEFDRAIWWIKQEGGYDVAVAMFTDYSKFEHEIKMKSYAIESIRLYVEFLKKEKKFDKKRVTTLFEKYISVNMLSQDLWNDYINFLIKYDFDIDVIKRVVSRAVKNVTWDAGCWILFILSNPDRMKELCERALLALNQVLRSDLDSAVEIFELCAICFADNVHSLQLFQPSGDPKRRIERLLVKKHLKKGNSKLSEAQKLQWNTIFYGKGSACRTLSQVIFEYVSVLSAQQACEELRKLINDKNIVKIDLPDLVLEEWRHLALCLPPDEAFKEILKLRILRAKVIETRAPVYQQQQPVSKTRAKKRAPELSEVSEPEESGVEESKKLRVVGPGRLKDDDPEKEKSTVFVSNLPPEITEDKLAYLMKSCGPTADIRLVKDEKHKRTFAYVEFPGHDGKEKALELDKTPIEGTKRLLFVSEFRPKQKPVAEKTEIYVSNLPDDIEEDVLKQMFEECGEIKSLRLIKSGGKRDQKKSPFAFIEFVDVNAADLSLGLDNFSFNEDSSNPIKVERSKKPKLHQDDHKKTMKIPPPALGSAKPHKIGGRPVAMNFSHSTESKTKESEKSKSNDEFRSLFLKK